MELDHSIWMERAWSSLRIAENADFDGVYLEDLCFQAQQAVEKGLKAVLVKFREDPPRTHNLTMLLKQVSRLVDIEPDAGEITSLTDYAFLTRYPGAYAPVDHKEYEKAISIARTTLSWISGIIDL